MLVINLWGGPGAGKSTVAAEVFVKLRQRTEANVELTNEFATELCFEQAKENLKDQVYLLGNQWHRLWRLSKTGVDVAVCDSPIGMGSAYHKEEVPYQDAYDELANKLRFQYPTIDIMIDRDIYSEGGFKGNTKKRNLNWLNQLDKKIATFARASLNVMFTKDGGTGGEVAEYCIPRVRKYLAEQS